MPTGTSSPSGGGQQTAWGSRFSFVSFAGFVPRNLSAAPRSAACFVADQLEVSPDEIQSYARRERLLDAPVTGTWKNSKLGLSNGPLSTRLRRFSFAALVSGCAPRGSSFQHPTAPPIRSAHSFTSKTGATKGLTRLRKRQKTFDALRDWQNHENGWSRPDDPERARDVQPGHRAYIEAAQLRAGLEAEKDLRRLCMCVRFVRGKLA